MQHHESQPEYADRRLNLEDQQAVLMLASRLQQEHDEGASLSDLVSIGEEAGLSREAVEEAYRRVTSQPSEKSQRELLGKTLSNELAAMYLTALWSFLTWVVVAILPSNRMIEQIALAGTFVVIPALTGALVRRPWVASAFGFALALNLATALFVRYGPPQGGSLELLLFFVPVLISFSVSLIGSLLTRSNDLKGRGHRQIQR